MESGNTKHGMARIGGTLLLLLLGGPEAHPSSTGAQEGEVSCPPECPAPGGGISSEGKPKRKSTSECYSEFGGVPDATKGQGFKVTCTDGDPSCDFGNTENACELPVVVCLNNTGDTRFPSCEPPGIPVGGITVGKVKVKGNPDLEAVTQTALQNAIDAILPAPVGTNPCTDPVTITVPLRERKGKLKSGKAKVGMEVNGESGEDNDKLQITCVREETIPCAVNPAGGPNKLTLTVGENADLDTGVSGISHNQGVTVGSKTFVCLKDCDLSTNPVCTGTGETNAGGKTGTINGDTFGAPLPLLSGGVPVCVINEYREDITLDHLDLATGDLSMKVRLLSKVHQGSNVEPAPCPTCRVSGAPAIGVTGRCERGPNNGQPCKIDGLTQFGPTSKDCPPPGANNVGNLVIDLNLTTGQVALPIDGFEGGQTCAGRREGGVGGPCPCAGQKQRNQCANENQCSADEPPCPTDLEPGVDQLCCDGSSGVSLGCYPGQGATDTDIIRTGVASLVFADPGTMSGAWPDPTYPKTTAEDGSLVSVFCIAATGSNVVDNVAGLPGPGAIILPGPMEVSRSTCAGGDNDGQACGAAEDCPGGGICR
jgi:hypothetical protein